MSEARPTSSDVAREAGVSRATVSYVLNGSADRISAETRDRVRAAAARLGYSSHGAAKTLKLGYSDVVLLSLPPWPLGPPVADMISTASRAIAELGYTPLIHLEQLHSPTDLATICLAIQPVGVIAPCAQFHAGTLAGLRASGTRAVIAYGERQVPDVQTLLAPQEKVGECAASYLARRGHTDVLGLMPASRDVTDLGRRRSAGAAAVCRKHGISFRCVQARIETGAVAAALRGPLAVRRPTAIFAFNDECALMAIRHLAEVGIQVPDEVAVIGCDNSPMAALAQPTLTSVRFRSTKSWQTLIPLLRRMIDGEALSGSVSWLEASVARRESA